MGLTATPFEISYNIDDVMIFPTGDVSCNFYELYNEKLRQAQEEQAKKIQKWQEELQRQEEIKKQEEEYRKQQNEQVEQKETININKSEKRKTINSTINIDAHKSNKPDYTMLVRKKYIQDISKAILGDQEALRKLKYNILYGGSKDLKLIKEIFQVFHGKGKKRSETIFNNLMKELNFSYKFNTTKNLQITCPECDKKMIKKKGNKGDFLGCSGYPECKFTMNLGGII